MFRQNLNFHFPFRIHFICIQKCKEYMVTTAKKQFPGSENLLLDKNVFRYKYLEQSRHTGCSKIQSPLSDVQFLVGAVLSADQDWRNPVTTYLVRNISNQLNHQQFSIIELQRHHMVVSIRSILHSTTLTSVKINKLHLHLHWSQYTNYTISEDYNAAARYVLY